MPRSHSVIHYITSMQTARMACGEPHPVYASLKQADITCPACCKVLRLQAMPESTLLKAVREAAHGAGYLTYHTYRSTKSEPGFVDLILARPGRPLYAVELKTATGKLTVEQARWQTTLAQCTGVVSALWRPADLPHIRALLEDA